MSETRARIHQEAIKLFVEKGYANTSIAQIERAAGLAPRAGGFYRHFSSKEELAADIGETCIIETRRDLGFDGVLPLGDTRAELILIAKGYRLAADRQAPLAGLIAEVRHLDKIRELEARVDQDLAAALTGWLAQKPCARGMDPSQLMSLALTIFGGWVFYLSKRGSAATPPNFTDEAMLDQWANLWSAVLTQPVFWAPGAPD